MENIADENIKLINNINESKDAFIEGEKAEKANDNIKAIEEYQKVIKEDISNYDIAKSKIKELNKKIENSIPIKIVSKRLDRNSINSQILKLF